MPRPDIRVGGRPVRLRPPVPSSGGGGGGVPSSPLLRLSDLQYLGAFRVPNYYDGTDEMSYGGTALAFNPANDSIFLAGHYQAVAEVSIPASIVDSADFDSLATATMLQTWVNVLAKLPNPVSATDPIGGLAIDGSRLIGTQYAYYTGAAAQTTSHFLLSSLDLAASTAGGMYQVGDNVPGARFLSGYISPIPAEWQAALGARFLSGLSDVPILTSTSAGPAAFGFEPDEFGSPGSRTIPYLYYPTDHHLGPYVGLVNPIQSGTTQIGGIAFPPGTGTVLYMGRTGTNYSDYGNAGYLGDPDSGRGPKVLNGEYSFQIWAYRAADFAAVVAGTLQPWQVKPYAVWNLSFPINTSQNTIGGATFDPGTGRLYVTLYNADQQSAYSNLPLILVFQVDVPSGVQPPAAPTIGTLAVTPTALGPGAIPAGSPTTLTAGNVYAVTPGATVTSVDFYLDANADGALQAGTDTHLGAGAGTANMPDGSSTNWALTFSTSGLPAGDLTAFARATDSDGRVSAPIAAPFSISHTSPVPVLAANAVSSSRIDLSWTLTGDYPATSLTLERSADLVTFATVASPTSSPYADTGLAGGTLYYYRMSSANAAGSSSTSIIVFASTL